MQCVANHLRQCAFAPIVRELRLNADPDREAEHNVEFAEMMNAFYEEGDHFGDYDGSLTSVSSNSMCF